MKKRTFEFDCSNGFGESLAEVMYHYAHAAYPPGGSECATATRTAMLELVEKLRSHKIVEISTRQRPTLVSAVSWFYTEMNKTEDLMYRQLTERLKRK